jgi:hypothetical protein
VVFAGIVFGPLGPVQHIRYSDTRVRVDVAYRIGPDRVYGHGEAAMGPSIATGSVTLVVGGVRRVVDLAALFPIREHHIDLSPNGSCGTGAAVTRHGSYLAVEAILGEKGCAALVALIDLDRGTVLERVALDHPSAHRFDARPQSLVGESLRVVVTQILNVPGNVFLPSGSLRAAPWWVVAVRAVDAQGRERDFAYCAADYCAAGGEPPIETVPRAGSRVVIGSLQGGMPFILRTMLGERVIRLSRSDERRFEALQTPVPEDSAQLERRNSWFDVASQEAYAEHFDAAIAAMEHMVAIDESGASLDPSIAAMDRAELAHCRALAVRIRAGTLSRTDAKALFTVGCVPIPKPVPRGPSAR